MLMSIVVLHIQSARESHLSLLYQIKSTFRSPRAIITMSVILRSSSPSLSRGFHMNIAYCEVLPESHSTVMWVSKLS